MEMKLSRSTHDKMFAGVAAGIADYANIDPTIVRMIFAIMALTGGHGLLVYLILWLVMPENGVSSKVEM